jgi:hypothetical protein
MLTIVEITAADAPTIRPSLQSIPHAILPATVEAGIIIAALADRFFIPSFDTNIDMSGLSAEKAISVAIVPNVRVAAAGINAVPVINRTPVDNTGVAIGKAVLAHGLVLSQSLFKKLTVLLILDSCPRI